MLVQPNFSKESALMRQYVLPVLLLILVGCSKADLLQKFASPEDQAVAKNYINLLRQQQFEVIETDADSSIAGASLHETLVKMSALIPPGEPTSVTLVGAQQRKMAGTSTVNLTFEYGFSGKWLITNVAVKKQGDKTTIVGFTVIPQPTSLEEQNKFTLSGKTTGHYLVLALAIVFPFLTLYALVVCIRTKFRGRKWPWVLFVIFGLGTFSVNWTTGKGVFLPLSFQLFSAGASAPLYGPWTLAVSVPVGAVTFLLLRKKLSTQTLEDEQTVQSDGLA
jgi:hypothetical protein